jgi:hypothetical protein
MESLGKSEIKSPSNTGNRSEIPANRFELPGNTIRDAQQSGNRIQILDGTGKKTSPDLLVNIVGDLCGRGDDFIVTKKDGFYTTRDIKGHPIQQPKRDVIVGEFRSANGSTMIFEKDGHRYIYNKTFKQQGNRLPL